MLLFAEGLSESHQMPEPGEKRNLLGANRGTSLLQTRLSAALTQASQLIRLRYKPGLLETQIQAMKGCGQSLGGACFLPLSEMNSLFGKGGRRS